MKKLLALLLSVLMLVSVVPFAAFAANDYSINSTTSTDDYYNLISKKDWDIAPGITESEIVLNNDDGSHRQVLYVMEADLNNEYVKVINSYMGMKPQYGDYKIAPMSQQAAYAEANGYGNVVGAMNTTLSWYTGYAVDRINEPLGFIMVDAEIYFDPGNCGYTYGNVGFPSVLVINKDFDEEDNPRPADIPKVEMPQIRSAADLDGWEDQVIPCSSGYIVKDGVNLSNPSHTGGAPRSVVGIKPDGTVVIMANDGRQAPYSEGMSMYELAEVMLDLGCSYVVNCDGGGSTTWVSQRPGEDLKINNSPSDGAERSTTTGILFISTAPATGEFVRASISTDEMYYTPGSSVQFNAVGTDLVGTPADIPEDAVWQLSDPSVGTIDQNGLFVSNGKVGTVTAQLVFDGKVVGEATINIVIPDSIAFSQKTYTVPYGKTIELDIVATYGASTVALNDDDIFLSLSDEKVGTLNGFSFTAGEEDTSVTGSTISAVFANSDITCSAELLLGKGSDVVFDFDEGTEDFYLSVGTKYGLTGKMYSVTEETGKVYRGDGALAMEMDLTDATFQFTGGYLQSYIGSQWFEVDEGATNLGLWVYFPEIEELGSLALRLYVEGYNYNVVDVYTVKPGDDLGYDGWRYISADISSIGDTFLYVSFYPMILATPEGASKNAKYTFYIDDITVDYSTAVDDREPPVFGDIGVFYDGIDTPVSVNGQVVNTNKVSFTVKATENTLKSNYTGLNVSSAKAYVDGVLLTQNVKCTADGAMSISDITLPNGRHTVRFELCDNMGNKSYKEGYITVDGTSAENTISVVPSDPNADRILIGSLYWLDVKASAIEDVQSVTTVIDLNSINTWELEHMEVAEGFSATYSVDSVTNNATITITKTGDSKLTGTAVLAKLPIRTWESNRVKNGEYTPEQMWESKWICHMDIKLSTDLGIVTFSDGSTSTFSMIPVAVDTELYSNSAGMGDDYSSKTSWHIHTPEALTDLAATCTKDGYIGRTYCEVCDSVVEWGETIPKTGHDFILVDGVYVCENCGDENGSANGLIKDGDVYRYFVDGIAQSGWQYIEEERYYFRPETNAAEAGDYVVNALYFETDETGKVIGGVWAKTVFGFKYDTTPFRDGWLVVDGREYYIDHYYRLENGYEVVYSSKDGAQMFYFENGICIKDHDIADGFYKDRNGLAYVKNGEVLIGLHEINGDYYYFAYNGYAVTGSYAGYLFGDDYKAISGLVDVDGTLCYYENGKPKMAGLVDIDGELYFAYGSKGQVAIGETYVWQGNDILPNGTYEFGADGKILDGIVDKDGVLCYYENGQPKMAGLVEINGDYYFAYGKKGEVAIGETYVWQGNDILPNGTYEFGADGKMLDGIVDKDGVLCYYENGQPKMAGLVEINGDYYFAYGKKGEVATGAMYVWKANDIELENPNCEFGADGKMLNGIVEKDGVLCYYVMGLPKMAGLININGDYYFAYGKKGEIATGAMYVWKANDIELENPNCEFGADGKMLNGIVEKDGVLCYYVMGLPKMAGLININGDYYFAYGKKGEVAVNTTTYIWNTNGIELESKNCEFGADGKMLNGLVEKNGVKYYYEMGRPKMAGLVEIDGDYYFANGKDGSVATESVYVWQTNGLMENDTYTFGADGKMLDGFVTVDGVLCYYETGKYGEVGLNYIDGDYYFIDYGGKVWTNGTFYVWDTNDLSIGMKYTFDQTGKIIK